MATYNGEKYIREQLNSILNQTVSVDEIIVSDDNSTDLTIKIIEEIKDSRISIIYNKSKGYVSNFENALENATGDYIFLADQDDIWDEKKVEVIIPLFEEYDLINHDGYIVDKNGEKLFKDSYFEIMKSRKGIIKNIIRNTYLGCCMAFKREVLEKALRFSSKNVIHDIWLGIVAEKFGKVIFLEKKLLKYRRHGENASFSTEKSKRKFSEKIISRFYLIKNILFLK